MISLPPSKTHPIALVTGATSGLGRCLAQELIKQGWFVIGVAKDADKLGKCVEDFGKDFYPLICNVSHESSVKHCSQDLKSKGISPTLFFLNAGCGDLEVHGNCDIALHTKTFQTNYFGAMTWVQEWLKECLSYGGTFVCISSLVALQPTPHAAAYCASKSALKSAFDSLKIQYINSPVQFITVLPGPMKTNMLKSTKSVPFTSLPEDAARYILRKVFSGKQTITFPFVYKLIFSTLSYLPTKIVARILK